MMRQILLPVSWFCSLLFLSSCAVNRLGTQGDLLKGPPATYIAPEEVSVGDWLTYIVATSFPEEGKTVMLGDHYELIRSKLPVPDSGGWNNYTINAFLRQDQKPVAVEFFNDCNRSISHVAVGEAAADSIRKFHLMDLPITGITYEQAMAYVDYMQHVLNTCALYTRGKYRYACFLPSPEVFDAYQPALDSVNTLGCNLFNYKNALCTDCPTGQKFRMSPVFCKTGMEPTYTWGYFPDPSGIKNFKGNVAEMTAVKGIAKGGSCLHYAAEASKGATQVYTGPARWLGFRVWYRKVRVAGPRH